jgi:hypothetical protein
MRCNVLRRAVLTATAATAQRHATSSLSLRRGMLARVTHQRFSVNAAGSRPINAQLAGYDGRGHGGRSAK